METSFCFVQNGLAEEASDLIEAISSFSEEKKVQTYILKSPLSSKPDEYNYSYDKGIIIMTPDHKIIFVDCLNIKDSDSFQNYTDDVLEDISFIP